MSDKDRSKNSSRIRAETVVFDQNKFKSNCDFYCKKRHHTDPQEESFSNQVILFLSNKYKATLYFLYF